MNFTFQRQHNVELSNYGKHDATLDISFRSLFPFPTYTRKMGFCFPFIEKASFSAKQAISESVGAQWVILQC
ncbi:hypothetical protein HN873_028709, partial [Arachis hypogaea]